jgi:hypothetical protein
LGAPSAQNIFTEIDAKRQRAKIWAPRASSAKLIELQGAIAG